MSLNSPRTHAAGRTGVTLVSASTYVRRLGKLRDERPYPYRSTHSTTACNEDPGQDLKTTDVLQCHSMDSCTCASHQNEQCCRPGDRVPFTGADANAYTRRAKRLADIHAHSIAPATFKRY